MVFRWKIVAPRVDLSLREGEVVVLLIMEIVPVEVLLGEDMHRQTILLPTARTLVKLARQ
jgi:hypothetical protein